MNLGFWFFVVTLVVLLTHKGVRLAARSPTRVRKSVISVDGIEVKHRQLQTGDVDLRQDDRVRKGDRVKIKFPKILVEYGVRCCRNRPWVLAGSNRLTLTLLPH